MACRHISVSWLIVLSDLSQSSDGSSLCRFATDSMMMGWFISQETLCFIYCRERLQNYTKEKQKVSWEVNILSVIYHDCHEWFIAALSNVQYVHSLPWHKPHWHQHRETTDEIYTTAQHQERFRQKQVERKPSTAPFAGMVI